MTSVPVLAYHLSYGRTPVVGAPEGAVVTGDATMNTPRAVAAALIVVGGVALATPLPASAHAVHHVTTGNGGTQNLAHDRNHGTVQTIDGLAHFCLDAGELATDGHTLSGAMYGIETAHHGPDAGGPGLADGCYATSAPPADNNPAID